jgi:PrtD family type I secretion system ABC transporter
MPGNVSTKPMAGRQSLAAPRAELVAALASCRGAVAATALFSGMINLLTLTGAFFMLQIYDRVLPGRSVPTLVALAAFAGVLFVFLGILDLVRGRVLIRIGSFLDHALSRRVYRATVKLPLSATQGGSGSQPLRDLDQMRSFFSGSAPVALFDLPWLPIYFVICYLFHPLIGVGILIGAAVLLLLALLTEVLARGPTRLAAAHAGARSEIAESGRRNAEVLQAMGMTDRIAGVWAGTNSRYLESQQRASDVTGTFSAVSRVFRMAFQSAILAIGAWLVLQQEATGGVIIASAILSARALAPVELAIGNWQSFLSARQSWRRLNELLALFPVQDAPMALPDPTTSLSIEGVSVAPPGSRHLVVQDVIVSLKRGDGLGIIGPSASGKSSLARAMVGIWPLARGRIRIDGASLDQWSAEALGRHIGYLPQDVELFAGTVAQNISRFDPEAEPEAIIGAARVAGVHEVVLRLPDGYETQIGESGRVLSAGQSQRIALARALYRDPFLVVLDEPNSNLDAEGDAALTQAILRTRARGGIVVVIAHRPSGIEGVDLLLAMANGKAQSIGPKEEVLGKVLRTVPNQRPPLRAVPDMGNAS